MSRRDTPLSIEVPAPESERPAWGKVGVVAAAGFVVGILWPRLTGTRIAPNPPSDAVAAVAGSASGAVAIALSPGGAPLAPPGVLPPTAEAVGVSGGAIVRCRDAQGETKETCGSLEFDPVALPKIKGLSRCPAASAATGKLSIGFDVDFRKKSVKVLLGKSTTLPRDKAEALIKCADGAFDKVDLAEMPHDYRRYTIFYTASFAPQHRSGEPTNENTAVEGPVAGTTTSESPAAGTATVNWDVAIVREAPKTGTIVGRVLRGSKVKVVSHQGEWYRVQYGPIEGWVYRGTIGL